MGLVDAQMHALAVTCAQATLRWANSDPDASLRDVDEAERFAHDLITERWEWTASAYDGTDLAGLRELYPSLDPAGRVRRGGRGAHLAACSVARMPVDPAWQADATGFRLARDL